MTIFFIGLTTNFLRLSVEMTSKGLTVGYGILRKKISWDRVEGCHIDERSAWRYEGWGDRLMRIDGKWRSIYNVFGSPRVVVSLNRGWIRELVFSTRNPEKAIETIENNLRK